MISSHEEFYNSAVRAATTETNRRNSHKTELFSVYYIDELGRKDVDGELIIWSRSIKYKKRIVPSIGDIYTILHKDHFGTNHGAASTGKRMYYRLRLLYHIKGISDLCY